MKDNIEIGDVFEIETANGKAYIQLVEKSENQNELELIRVYYKIYLKSSCFSITKITEKSDDYFFLSFHIKAALKLKVLKFVCNTSIKRSFKTPVLFRTKNPFGNGWNIIDKKKDKYIKSGVINLNEEQKKLSPWGTWNDTLLIENLEKGWRLENWT